MPRFFRVSPLAAAPGCKGSGRATPFAGEKREQREYRQRKGEQARRVEEERANPLTDPTAELA